MPEFQKAVRACIMRQLNKGEKELDEAIEVYQNAS
jgi:exonuclease VII small subunit